MQKILFLSLIILMSANVVSGQSKNETTIRSILAAQTSAWNNGNLNTFMKGYWQSDSLMFIGKSGITYGWQKTLDNYKKNYPDTASMGKLNFDLLSLKPIAGDYYFVVGKWYLTRSVGNVGGIFTLLFRKIKNEWVIVADHSS